MLPDLEQLNTLNGYRKHFMDEDLWRVHVQSVCQRHGLHPCRQVRAGLAGSFPTFIVEDRWVVKFFGQLFDGEQSFETELQVNHLLPPDLAVHAAELLYSGYLIENSPAWKWPYLIFEYLPGVSLGEVFHQVSFEDKVTLARALGQTSRQMLRIPVGKILVSMAGRAEYGRFLVEQRAACIANHRQWQSLPAHLIDQIDEYLLPVQELADPGIPHGLLHADLTRDHILGRLEGGKWVTVGLIDFGDARAGNIYYDLGALHLDLFRGDKRLLKAYLESYKLPGQQQFVHKAMSVALMHQFNIFIFLYEMFPQARQAATLNELADLIWNI